jgi:hypothetical protein
MGSRRGNHTLDLAALGVNHSRWWQGTSWDLGEEHLFQSALLGPGSPGSPGRALAGVGWQTVGSDIEAPDTWKMPLCARQHPGPGAGRRDRVVPCPLEVPIHSGCPECVGKQGTLFQMAVSTVMNGTGKSDRQGPKGSCRLPSFPTSSLIQCSSLVPHQKQCPVLATFSPGSA